jgi:hypothetical protein
MHGPSSCRRFASPHERDLRRDADLVHEPQAPFDLNGTRRGRGWHHGLKLGQPLDAKLMYLLVARQQRVDVFECFGVRQVPVLGGILLRRLDLAIDNRALLPLVLLVQRPERRSASVPWPSRLPTAPRGPCGSPRRSAPVWAVPTGRRLESLRTRKATWQQRQRVRECRSSWDCLQGQEVLNLEGGPASAIRVAGK